MWLFDRVKEHLQRRGARGLALDRSGRPADLELQAATAVLLLEAAYGDEQYLWREHHAIVRGLKRAFGIDRKQVSELMARAEEIRPPVVTLADLTQVMVDRFDEKQREEVLALVWEVINADDVQQSWEVSFAEHVAQAVGLAPEQARRVRDSTVTH